MPHGLGRRGASFLRWAGRSFELDPPHRALVVEAARMMDLLDALAVQVERDGLTVAGSTGQPRPHPLLAEQRSTALALSRLLDALGLDPPEEEAPESRTSARARHAALVRWHGPSETVTDLAERRGR